MPKRELNDAEKEIVKSVEESGFFSTGVGAGDDDPNFLYTTGLWETLGTPELVVFGLPPDVMHAMVWATVRQMKKGLRLRDGARVAKLVRGDFECVARPVHPSQLREYLLSARWYRKHRGKDLRSLKAFQLFWPSRFTRLYPWDGKCEADVRELQPLLYLPRKSGLA